MNRARVTGMAMKTNNIAYMRLIFAPRLGVELLYWNLNARRVRAASKLPLMRLGLRTARTPSPQPSVVRAQSARRSNRFIPVKHAPWKYLRGFFWAETNEFYCWRCFHTTDFEGVEKRWHWTSWFWKKQVLYHCVLIISRYFKKLLQKNLTSTLGFFLICYL